MEQFKKRLDYMLRPFHIKDYGLPEILDYGPRGYADGKDKRRARREQERKKKNKR